MTRPDYTIVHDDAPKPSASSADANATANAATDAARTDDGYIRLQPNGQREWHPNGTERDDGQYYA